MPPELARDLGYTLRRYYIDEFFFRHVPTIAPGSLVLDAGGVRIRKRGRFDIGKYDLCVTYVNLSPNKRPHAQADVASLPFADSCFDIVICAEVLEHVPDPRAVLRELHRVLKPGGTLLACVPFLVRIHADPYDYGRYTAYFWQENLAHLGFGDVLVERQGLFWSVLADMARGWVLELAREGSPRSRHLRALLARAVIWGREKAVRWDGLLGDGESAFFRSYTTGFGIKAIRL